MVRWQVAEADALHAEPASYEIEVHEAPGGSGAHAARHTAPGRARDVTVNGLLPGTSYQARPRS